MQDSNEQEKEEWYDPIVEFAAHFIAASVIFVMLGAFTTGLHFYVEWLKSLKVEPIFIYTFKGRATSKSVFTLNELISFVQKSPFPLFQRGNLKVSLCKGRFRGIFDPAQHDFDETLPSRGLSISYS